MTAHADFRPPSSASRWLSCPGSVQVVQTYENLPSEASIKGDIAHALLEDAILWGTVPNHPDVDIMYGVMMAMEYVNECLMLYQEKGSCLIEWETSLDIPETGEFGTPDVVFVTESLIHIIDYKNGFVPVDIKMNAQLMLYLLGAIHKYGERKHYKLTVIQPNYVHSDGMIRHFEPTAIDVEWFRGEVGTAMASQTINAGKHCKTSYCPARGTCAVFRAWAPENLKLAYYPGETVAMSDDELAEALDEAEILQGWRDALRGEAMRRILQQDRKINGYKLVKARQVRDFRDDAAREKVFKELKTLGATDDELYTKSPISVASVEKVVKRIFKSHGRGAWLKGMDHVCPPDCLQPQNKSITLEKAIDGRKEYKRGQEFDAIDAIDVSDAKHALSN